MENKKSRSRIPVSDKQTLNNKKGPKRQRRALHNGKAIQFNKEELTIPYIYVPNRSTQIHIENRDLQRADSPVLGDFNTILVILDYQDGTLTKILRT